MLNPSVFAHLHKIPALIEMTVILKILVAFVIGGYIGWEREKSGKGAGVRTFGLICAGSCVFSILSLLVQDADTARIVSFISLGIGFICGTVIYIARDGDQSLEGLTTAASLWVTAGIGILIAFELYVIALASAVLTLIALMSPSLPFWLYFSKKKKRR